VFDAGLDKSTRPYPKVIKAKRAMNVVLEADHLPRKHETLSSTVFRLLDKIAYIHHVQHDLESIYIVE
jgi:hypothetical protein